MIETSDERAGLLAGERLAFTALVALLAAPPVAHGLWRPLVHGLGPSGAADMVTGAALATSGLMVVVHALGPGRFAWHGAVLGGSCALGASLGASLGLAGLVALLCVAAATAWLVRWLPPRLPAALDGLARRHRLLSVLYAALALAAIFGTARLGTFMGDPTQVDQQVLPGEEFIETHSCLTAYVHADRLCRDGVDNLYAERWWHGSHGFPPAAPGAEDPYRPFALDYYAYPPPFLLVMLPLAPFEADFLAQRALWFGLNAIGWMVALWAVARFVEGPGAHRVLLLAPLFFGTLPVLATLQVGNFQLAVVAMSVLAMVAFHRGRRVVGGALLAFAILSKISPGVLGIVLLVQRRWAEAAWTAGFGAIFVGIAILLQGPSPTVSFLTYTLARLGSGEAFAFMDDDTFSVITNMAPFGVPFKLELAGLEVGDPWLVGRNVGRVYSVALVIVAVLAARRRGEPRTQAVTWMSLLVLAALQSPFAPGYTTIALLWATTLVAVEVRRLRGVVALVLVWISITVVPPFGPHVLAVHALLQSAITVGVPLWLVARGARATA